MEISTLSILHNRTTKILNLTINPTFTQQWTAPTYKAPSSYQRLGDKKKPNFTRHVVLVIRPQTDIDRASNMTVTSPYEATPLRRGEIPGFC